MITKPCPECGARLTVRKNRETGEEFIGCTRYPECTHTESLPERLKMIERGYPTLPGMEVFIYEKR